MAFWRLLFLLGAAQVLIGGSVAYGERSSLQTLDDVDALELDELSLEDLLDIPISSVSRIAENSSTSPSVMTIITQEQIRSYGYRTLWDILIHVPGFWEIQDVNDKLVGVRGVHASTSQKWLVLINGKRLTENLWNLMAVDYNLSLTNVKWVEIIRGPGSAVYGLAALTTVINIVTDSEIDGMQLTASVGNHGYHHLSFAYSNRLDNSIEVWGHLAGTEGERRSVPASQDGALNPVDGIEIVDRFPGFNGSLGMRSTFDEWTLQLVGIRRQYKQPRSGNAALTWQDIEENEYFSSYYKNGEVGEEHVALSADLERSFETGPVMHSINGNFTYSQLRLRENTLPYRDNVMPEEYDKQAKQRYSLGQFFEFDIASYRLGLDYFGNLEFSEGRLLLWGLEGMRVVPTKDAFTANFDASVDDGELKRSPTPGGYLYEKPDGVFDKLRTEYMVSGYSELRWQFWRRYYLSFGGRYDMHVKGDDFRQEGADERYPDPQAEKKRQEVEKTSSQLSPRLALVYQPFGSNRLTFKAIYNRSFIAPAGFYRYADPSTSYSGGPWLKPETLDSFIGATEGVIDDFGWKALVFLNINSNLLTRDTSYQPARYESVGSLAMYGSEIELYYEMPWVSAFTGYSYLRGYRGETDKDTEKLWIMDNGSIKNFPEHHGTVGLSGRALDRQLHASVLTLWHGPIASPVSAGVGSGTVATIEPTAQVDVTLRWAPTQIDFLYGFELRGSVFNILDTPIKRGGTVRRPYYKAGRWFNISVSKVF